MEMGLIFQNRAMASWFAAFFMALVLVEPGVVAAPLLPSPFTLPKTPVADGVSCASCPRQTQAGADGAAPHVGMDARASLDISLTPPSSLARELLTINVGADMAFYPSEKYQLLPPSVPKGEKDILIVMLGALKIGFKSTVGGLGGLAFQSFNHPGYTIKRDGEFLVVNDLNDDLLYRFGSPDSGYSWRLVCHSP